jgi:hypothetical protein
MTDETFIGSVTETLPAVNGAIPRRGKYSNSSVGIVLRVGVPPAHFHFVTSTEFS